ncbi:hypothetical protein BBEV_0395 [Salisediminibacterium beveridgei]|uniref:Uncharacterized protein n=1 Tax=Salisediminibacterium beveridgei TaxID=632773 RepID=A0A1D7QS19_9BACI|nr:hypothetical protein BBEV_0395 [Salisediminibacterium beveridgei]
MQLAAGSCLCRSSILNNKRLETGLFQTVHLTLCKWLSRKGTCLHFEQLFGLGFLRHRSSSFFRQSQADRTPEGHDRLPVPGKPVPHIRRITGNPLPVPFGMIENGTCGKPVVLTEQHTQVHGPTPDGPKIPFLRRCIIAHQLKAVPVPEPARLTQFDADMRIVRRTACVPPPVIPGQILPRFFVIHKRMHTHLPAHLTRPVRFVPAGKPRCRFHAGRGCRVDHNPLRYNLPPGLVTIISRHVFCPDCHISQPPSYCKYLLSGLKGECSIIQ